MTQIGESVAVPGSTTEDDTEAEPKIISVRWLNGDDSKVISNGWQFVNLPKDQIWVDAVYTKNKDRLGHKPRILVKFNKPGVHDFKLRLVPDTGNDAYTGNEEGRNGKFKYLKPEKSYTTDGDGTKIIDGDLFITVAGKHKYTIEAKDSKANEVSTGPLEVWRKVYYYEAKMRRTAAAARVDSMKTEFRKHNIIMSSAGSDQIRRIENIGSRADSAIFKQVVKSAFDGNADASSKIPHIIVIGYTDHLAVKDSNQTVEVRSVNVGPGKSKVRVPITDSSGNNKYLWQGIVAGESWFVSCEFKKDGQSSTVAVPARKVRAIDRRRRHMSCEVEVDVEGLDEGTGSIKLTVNWVNRMRGGLSFGGTNLVCVCTKAWWSEKSAANQNQVIIHEIGHQMEMVADGTKGPDKVPTHYVRKGHIGNHCYNGCGVLPNYSNARSSSECVMFGATNGKFAFCDNCAPAVKKQDFSSGFGSL